MSLHILDRILKFIPNIKKPDAPLTFKQKMKWTALIMCVYFLLFSIPAVGSNVSELQTSSFYQILNTVFAARTGTLVTVGISPIVLSSIVLQLVMGTGLLKVDLNDPEQKGRFQSMQKLFAILIAVVEGILFTKEIPLIGIGFFWLVALQLTLGAIFVIFLDEAMVKYGITSGINLFIAGGIAYAIIASTATVLVPGALSELATGGASALPDAVLAIAPLFMSILVMLVCIYIYNIKVELPLVFSQFRGIGGRLPIPLLYISVLPVILATSLILSLSAWGGAVLPTLGSGGACSPQYACFLGTYQNTNGQHILQGGLLYLLSPTFVNVGLPYPSSEGGVGYSTYFNELITQTTTLYLPWGGTVIVPEWVHIITYTLFLVILCVIFGKFWVEMTGQSPKAMAAQLQDVGWQIPGFRRDPRVVESVLNKYIPTITTLGSIIVALLAAFANLTGAVGTGMGILLTVGIIYMVYQQLEQQRALENIPLADKLLS